MTSARAIIEEAHKHNLKAVAHIFYLADAKELVRQASTVSPIWCATSRWTMSCFR